MPSGIVIQRRYCRMYAITARYAGPTESRGSRHIVRWGDTRRSIPYSYSASDAGQDAIERFVADSPEGQNLIRAGYRLTFGYMDPSTTVAVWTR